MDQRIKEMWINALESGEYKQGKGTLRKTDDLTGEHTYCCLGVLCDLYAKETGKQWSESGSIHGLKAFLPREVADWAGVGVTQRFGDFNGIDLVHHNDDLDSSFEKIAQLIRDNI